MEDSCNYSKEFPAEFCDPLLCTPIDNPVLLPESKIFMDKNSIMSHLMQDQTDPFNRTKLTKEELDEYNKQPDILEKIDNFVSKIEEWKKENSKKS